MPMIRNPFRKQDEHLRPNGIEGLEKPVEAGTKAIDIKESTEYKLSGQSMSRTPAHTLNADIS